jgi:hypothetical protein
MKNNVSFQERTKLSKEILSNQSSVTLEEAKKQVEWIKKVSSLEKKKKSI